MVRIRLRRMGAKKKPFYRIVVADQRSPRDGRFIENIGTYDPMTDPPTINVKSERAGHWLRVGAQPSEAVARLLKKTGITDEHGKLKEVEAGSDGAAEEAPAEPEAA
ncbi:MAG: 30S ribosomal protein S16 [Caldilineaceae bacterium]|uniref:Small ribosomal subunit protein bS16 n=1 Tax=Caldilineaceae bacterium SB0664_bin_27 TaxID=2605260 RepID=A0A6B0YXK9_9CHLR|nr:30S ribosomal protein S16 [Caldilineaceae bacterium]MDE0338006.1 30S ribosomal protein S16 [Caldilineaceae bacterium]MXY94138.1 30S ribosomal protein S16 [Caldilineaceae bacterium SB0664_bin_27]